MPDLGPLLGRDGELLRSPSRRCEAPRARVEERLRPWDLGAWTGRPFDDLDLATWRTDPSYDAHGGESLLVLTERVAGLLDDLQDVGGGRRVVVAVTHAAVIKAAVLLVLRAPSTAVWELDVHPASVTELSRTGDGWRVARVNAPYGS